MLLQRKQKQSTLQAKQSNTFRGKALQSYFSKRFKDCYNRLLPPVKKQADRAFDHLTLDPRYPSLQFKCVNQQKLRYSIRIGRKHRALGDIVGDDITWHWIGSNHDEYERKINE